MLETVHEVSFPAIAGFPASHLESHINDLLFENDMNQRENTSDGQRRSTDIMTETESGSGTLLNKQHSNFPAVVTVQMATDLLSCHLAINSKNYS